MPRKLSKTKLEKFKTTFEQKRKEILLKLSKSDDELDIDGDDVDIVQGRLISDINSRLSERELQHINRLDTALKKIEEGTFGVCDECDAHISEKRLLAVPGCTICILCAEQEEIESKQFAS